MMHRSSYKMSNLRLYSSVAAMLLVSGCGSVSPSQPDASTGTGSDAGTMQDTDGDGIPDAQEIAGWDIQVTRPDGRGRVTVHVTSDPTKADTDGDGISDHDELVALTDPRSADTDGDGLSDAEEPGLGTDPT